MTRDDLVRHFVDNGLAAEEALVARDDGSCADELVALLDHPEVMCTGVAAAFYAGKRARVGLDTLFRRALRVNLNVLDRIHVAIALIGDPDDAAELKGRPNYSLYLDAKRLHVALTGKKPAPRISAIDTIARSFEKGAFHGTLLGLCRLLGDETPEVVEHAALALRKHTEHPRALTTHHAVFLRYAKGAIERGVTAAAREAIDAVQATIPRAPALTSGAIVTGTLGPLPERKPRTKPGPNPHAHVTGNDDDLVRQIIAQPDDDTLRVVLADRLLERGDPRGEFIQLQLALGRAVEGAKGTPMELPSGWIPTPFHLAWNVPALYAERKPPKHAALAEREAELLRKHAPQWLEPIRPFLRTWAWWRGFVDLVTGKAATLLDGIEAIAAAHPTRIMLEALDDATLRRLETAPLGETRRLGALNVKEAMVHGFLGQNLSRLETLCLTGSFGDRGAIQLAQESHLFALKRLILGPANIKNAGLRAIASSTVLANLEELHIGDPRFNKATVEELVHSSALAKLKILFVGGKRVDLPR